jgi:hypothetical protein
VTLVWSIHSRAVKNALVRRKVVSGAPEMLFASLPREVSSSGGNMKDERHLHVLEKCFGHQRGSAVVVKAQFSRILYTIRWLGAIAFSTSKKFGDLALLGRASQ